MTPHPTHLILSIAALAALTLLPQPSFGQGPAKTSGPKQRAYASLEEIPPAVGERLPCPEEEGDECATRVRLLSNVTVWGVPLLAGTIATDWEEDRSGTLSRDFRYKGVWFKHGTTISMYTGWKGTLLRNQTFRGIPCRAETVVSFRSDGRLEECELATACFIDGYRYDAGTRLFFDENGKAVSDTCP